MTALTPLGAAVLIGGVLVGIGAALWWLLITTEGVYLGRRAVIWLYDVYARRYDRIKKYDAAWEGLTLARPVLDAFANVRAPLILDVATGTARLPLALLREPDFAGHVVGLDYSRKMLSVAAEKLMLQGALRVERSVSLIHQHAQALPFADETFDAVLCLEALEFMPNPNAVIAELVRVARPGALLLLTNRRGIVMPGKTQRGETLARRLRGHFGLIDVSIAPWQVDYEQVWAFKPGDLDPALGDRCEGSADPFDIGLILRCPRCGQRSLIRLNSQTLHCVTCERRVAIGADGVIEYASAANN